MDLRGLSRICDSNSELESLISEFVADLTSGPEQSEADFEYNGHTVFGEFQNDDEVSLVVYVDDEEVYNVGSFDDDFEDTDEYWNSVERDLKKILKSTLSKVSDSRVEDKAANELFNEGVMVQTADGKQGKYYGWYGGNLHLVEIDGSLKRYKAEDIQS